MIVGVALKIGRTNASIPHNGAGRSGFIGSSCGAIATVVLGVVSSELVADFMADVVNVERVADRRALPGNPSGFAAATRRLEIRDTTSASREYVPNVIIGRSNYTIACVDVLSQHGSTVVVGIGVCACIQKNQLVVVVYDDHSNGYVALENTIHANHGGIHRSEYTRDRATMKLRVFTRASEGKPVCSQLVSIVCFLGQEWSWKTLRTHWDGNVFCALVLQGTRRDFFANGQCLAALPRFGSSLEKSFSCIADVFV